jgi:hypothetical protein
MHPAPKLEHGGFYRVVGEVSRVQVETSLDPARVDHVWLFVNAGEPLLLAINTLSKLNRDAGFESRVSLAIIEESCETLPATGIFRATGLDYPTLEATLHPAYARREREEMERLLVEKGKYCCLVEAWGEIFLRPKFGLHQVHSRRASCAVERELIGRDGALKFYYPDRRSELLLLKFCGQ